MTSSTTDAALSPVVLARLGDPQHRSDVPFEPCCRRTFMPDEDELFTAMAELFEILDLA